ncbi:MAG TPA: 2-oxoacid:acceptor oxidoreductase family protein [bacterium]|nr:2-oxoacid:acceptor oxidoreductase family protein [bacterium]
MSTPHTLSFRFAGFGGQGVLLMGMMVSYAGMEEGKHVTWLPSYGAEMRGGTANCTVVVSDKPIASPVIQNPDVAVVMNEPSLAKFEPLVRKGGTLFINSSLVTGKSNRSDIRVVYIPATDAANELGTTKVANMVMLGAVVGDSGVVSVKTLHASLLPVMGMDKQKLEALNIAAMERGVALLKG